VVTTVRRQSALSEFFTGTGLLFRGIGLVARSPRMLLLGLVPGVIALIVVVAALSTLLYFIMDVAAVVTWFADGWASGARQVIRVLAAFAIGAGAIVLAIIMFTALTMTIGDPFYESLSKQVDERYGGAPEADIPWYRTLRWNLADSLRLIVLSMCASIALFLFGLIPVVGQTVGPVIGAVIGGWLLTMEISGIPFNRRGLRLRDRRRLLGANRPLALGFGVPIFVVFLVPFIAVFVMPGAVAGATLLTRRVLGQPHE
jgi:CysZ protein